MNLLTNPSFEDGHHHQDGIPELVVPDGWFLHYLDGVPFPGIHDGLVAYRPESVCWNISGAPPDEHDIFFLDGDYCLKVFKPWAPIYFALTQHVTGLTPGAAYLFNVPVHPDIVESYSGDQKVYPSDIWAAEARAGWSAPQTPWPAGGDGDITWSDWFNEYNGNFEFGEYGDVYVEFVAPASGEVRLWIECKAKYGFPNNAFFMDALSLDELDGGDPPPPEPGDCEAPARVPYGRRYILLPPTATFEEAQAVLSAEWDTRPTIGFSADDAGIGCGLSERIVDAVRPEDWPDGGLTQAWYDTWYPSTVLRAYGSTPPPPPPPPPATKTTNGYIGSHIQALVPGILEYIARVKPPVAKIFGAGDVFPIKAASPDTHVIFRKYLHNSEQQDLLDMPDKHAAAQLYIDSFLDVFNYVVPELQALYPDQDPVLYVESLNEVYACNQTAYNANSALFDMALMEQVAAMDLPVRCVVFCAPQGNPEISGDDLDVLLVLARAVEQHGGWMGYHDYWGANIIYPPNHLVDAGWPWSPGRWQLFDDYLTSKGVYVTWVGGESGACTSENGYNLSSGGGWRAEECHDGSIARYVMEIMYVDALDAAWDAQNGGRRIGRVLFTDGLTGAWDLFECGAALWNAVSDAMIDRYGG